MEEVDKMNIEEVDRNDEENNDHEIRTRTAVSGPKIVPVLDSVLNIEEVETNDEEDNQDYNEWDDKWGDGDYVDQKTGQPLDPALARQARLEEVSFMKKIGLYDEVP